MTQEQHTYGPDKFEVQPDQWQKADDSQNTIELNRTDRSGVLALRTTYSQNPVIMVTERQINNLVQAAQQGRLRQLGIRSQS